jgi:microcystin-dependent protein
VVRLFGHAEAASDEWLPCDGSTIDPADYPALQCRLAADGFPFGGDTAGADVPDLRGRAMMGTGGGLALGDHDGSSTVTLTEDELPEHSHTIPLRELLGNGGTGTDGLYVLDLATDGEYSGSLPNQAHNNRQPSFVGHWMIYAGCVAVRGGGVDGPTLGEIREFSHDEEAAGWLACGAAYSRSEYPWLHALYEAAGYPHGTGDGSTTFGTPATPGRIPIGDGVYPTVIGETLGTEEETLLIGHQVHAHGGAIVSAGSVYHHDSGPGMTLPTASYASSEVGSGTAHNNMAPSLAVEYRVFAGVDLGEYPDGAELVTVPATMTESLTATVVIRVSPGTAWTLTIDGETFATGTGTGTNQTVLAAPTVGMLGSARAVVLTAGDATDTDTVDVLVHVYLHTVPEKLVIGTEATIVVIVTDGEDWTLTVDGEAWKSGTGTGAAQNATATPTSAMGGPGVAVVLAVGSVEDTDTTDCGSWETISLAGHFFGQSAANQSTMTASHTVHAGDARGLLIGVVATHSPYSTDQYQSATFAGNAITRLGHASLSGVSQMHVFFIPSALMGEAGSQTIEVVMAHSTSRRVWLFVELAGNDQAAPTIATIEEDSASPTGATVTVTVPNSWVVGMVGKNIQGAFTPQSGQTEIDDNYVDENPNFLQAVSGYEVAAAAGNYESAWSWAGTAETAAFAIAVAPAFVYP